MDDDAAAARRIARAVGWARIGFGSAMLWQPRLLPALVGFPAGESSAQSWLVMMVGAREAGLGIGTLTALSRGESPGPWLWAQALSDAGDAVAFRGLARRRVGRRRAWALAAFAASGAAADLATARTVDRRHG